MKFNIPAEHKNASGVYIIRNRLNEKVYVGSSKTLKKRFNDHLNSLLGAKHHSKRLQRFVTKYGIEVLSFDLLELTTDKLVELIACEQKWLDFYQASLPDKGYNTLSMAYSHAGYKPDAEVRAELSRKMVIRHSNPEYQAKVYPKLKGKDNTEQLAKITASRVGKPIAEEVKAKISATKKGRPLSDYQRSRFNATGRKHSPETIKKIAQSHKGKTCSAETRAKLSAINKGKTHNAETRAKLSAINKGRDKGKVLSLETKAKLSIVNQGKTHTAETKAKLSVLNQGKVLSSETKAKLSTLGKGRSHSLETRAKLSTLNKGKVMSPETRQKISEALKKSRSFAGIALINQLSLF